MRWLRSANGDPRRTFADAIIRDLLERSGLSVQDRAFALELFYGILRNRTLLNFWMDSLRDGVLDDATRDILSIGLYQLFMLRTPEHAALHETVELASKRRRGLINGILRAALRERDELEAGAKGQPIAIRLSHPEFLIERWRKRFGQQAAIELCEWNNEPPPTYGRINRLKIDPDTFFRSFSEFTPVPGAPDFFKIKSVPNELLDQGSFTSRIRALLSPANCSIRRQVRLFSTPVRHLVERQPFLPNKCKTREPLLHAIRIPRAYGG